jgi:hypothetical protein
MTLKKAWDGILRRANEDRLFRLRLLNDPRSVLEEAGIEIDQDREIRVVEQDPHRLHLILPPIGQPLEVDLR